jgi:hypothetical protein
MQRWFGVLACLEMMAGCIDPEPLKCRLLAENERALLVDHGLWRLATEEEDPWRSDRPIDIECDSSGRQPEDFGGQFSLGIDTGLCGYTTVVQETIEPICAGEKLFVWIWHFGLTGPEGSNAHLGVQIADELVYTETLPIPNTSGLIAEGFALKDAYPAGTKIYFHVRNHGANTYQLLELSRCTGECRP